jgi:hypothetical protein
MSRSLLVGFKSDAGKKMCEKVRGDNEEKQQIIEKLCRNNTTRVKWASAYLTVSLHDSNKPLIIPQDRGSGKWTLKIET